MKPNVGLDKRVTTLLGVEKNRLSRKKKNWLKGKEEVVVHLIDR